MRWFRHLGALQVESLPLVDRTSADDPAIADRLLKARLIYLLGGFPAHLALSLQGSRSWQAVLQAYGSGAVIAGSSAGAMVLCSDYFDPAGNECQPRPWTACTHLRHSPSRDRWPALGARYSKSATGQPADGNR